MWLFQDITTLNFATDVIFLTISPVLNMNDVGVVDASNEHGQNESWWIYIIEMNWKQKLSSITISLDVHENPSRRWVLQMKYLGSTLVEFKFIIVHFFMFMEEDIPPQLTLLTEKCGMIVWPRSNLCAYEILFNWILQF